MRILGMVAVAVFGLVQAPVRGAEDGARMVDQAWMAAVKSGNVDALAALYAPDATLYPVGGTEEVKGRAAIRVRVKFAPAVRVNVPSPASIA